MQNVKLLLFKKSQVANMAIATMQDKSPVMSRVIARSLATKQPRVRADTRLLRRRLLAMTILLFTTSVSAASPDWAAYQKSGHRAAKWDALVQSGFEAFDAGNFSTASNFLERARGRGCKDGLLLFKLGLYEEYLKEYPKAVDFLKSAESPLQKQYPNHETTRAFHENLGRVYYEWDHYEEALPHIQQSIAQLGENFMRLFMAGQILRMQQQWKEAIVDFEKSLQYETPAGTPGNSKLLVMLELTKAYAAVGNEEKALSYANAVLKIDPTNAMAQNYRQQIEHQKYQKHEREVMENMIK